jgi:hypothetical protein
VQLTIVLHLLQQGRLMFEYDSMKVLFKFLVVLRNNKKTRLTLLVGKWRNLCTNR